MPINLYDFLMIGMGIASVLFILAAFTGMKRKFPLHYYFVYGAVAMTLLVAISFVVILHFVLNSEIEAGGVRYDPNYPSWMALVHRMVAAIDLILMFFVLYLGKKRKLDLHLKIAPLFVLVFVLVYLSGLILFQRI